MTAAPDGLPPLAALETARLDWQRDDTGEEAPRSAAFDDVYFSRHDGRAETEHVFLGGNRLPQRFADWHARRPFVIGETGFGTGLNMLVAWACFDAHAPAQVKVAKVAPGRERAAMAANSSGCHIWGFFAGAKPSRNQASTRPSSRARRSAASPK